jgi:hypothetical protein
MVELSDHEILRFLEQLALRYTEPIKLYLLGGSALCLLGSPRRTLDIDYVGDDLHLNTFQKTIAQLAHEMKLEVEPVPLDQFIPLPDGAEGRSWLIGNFGSISVYVFDPYSIALSKIDRGSKIDLQDVIFLIHQKLITFERLEQIVQDAFSYAKEFSMNPLEMREHLDIVRQLRTTLQ